MRSSDQAFAPHPNGRGVSSTSRGYIPFASSSKSWTQCKSRHFGSICTFPVTHINGAGCRIVISTWTSAPKRLSSCLSSIQGPPPIDHERKSEGRQHCRRRLSQKRQCLQSVSELSLLCSNNPFVEPASVGSFVQTFCTTRQGKIPKPRNQTGIREGGLWGMLGMSFDRIL